jgi:hypothetical protein
MNQFSLKSSSAHNLINILINQNFFVVLSSLSTPAVEDEGNGPELTSINYHDLTGTGF